MASTTKQIDKKKITITLEPGTDNNLYAMWEWKNPTDVSDTENYEYAWEYLVEGGDWLLGNKGSQDVAYRQCSYSFPDNAKKVRFKVIPRAKTKTVNGKEQPAYTSTWSLYVGYTIGTYYTPAVPAVPTVEMNTHLDGNELKYTLTASVDTYDDAAHYIDFYVCRNDLPDITTKGGEHTPFRRIVARVKAHQASGTVDISPGSRYKVKARAIYRPPGNSKYGLENTKKYAQYLNDYEERFSNYSEYSENQGTVPAIPAITDIRVLSPTVVQVYWNKLDNVKLTDSYILEYSISKGYFGSGSSEVSQVTVEGTYDHAEIVGLETGRKWYFRMRAENEQGTSGWSEAAEKIVGVYPAAPTIWSASPSVKVGEPAKLYWVHNSKDDSSQTHAELDVRVDGTRIPIPSDKIGRIDEYDMLNSRSASINTSSYTAGAVLTWKVRTMGALQYKKDSDGHETIDRAWGAWSEVRTVKIYAPATLENPNVEMTEAGFPIVITSEAGPSNQKVLSFNLNIISESTYSTTDVFGEDSIVQNGDIVFQELIFPDSGNQFNYTLTPSMIHLENGRSYSVVLVAFMDSGLTAEASSSFTMSYSESNYDVNIEYAMDTGRYAVVLTPYCRKIVVVDDEETYEVDPDMTLSVYRREYDGTFVEIMSGIENGNNTQIVDLHPALDYARYRIVAIHNQTGENIVYDAPDIPMGNDDENSISSIVITWNEERTITNTTEEAPLIEQAYSGNVLVLPYNVDVSDNYSPDVSLVNYIGRQHPVSYYGTQLGISGTWNTEIPADDTDTLYALRRLAIYNGDVYIREPSGSGYWAQVTVGFSQKHGNLTIPVTLSVKRVEGGA